MTSHTPRPTIHWISPLPPAETDIAHYTARILPELSAQADVILWTDQSEWDLALEKYCTVKTFDPDTMRPRDFTAARTANGAEVLFLHIGNSWVYHSGLLRLAQRMPTVVVLHDLAIQELMVEAIRANEWDAVTYFAGMEKWYGATGLEMARACIDGREKASIISGAMPGFELVLENAVAVLTHTQFAHDAVQQKLPYLASQVLPLPFPIGRKPYVKGISSGPLRLLQFGWIGPNRRLEQILEALAQMPPDFDYRFDVMGKLWNPDLIYDKVSQLGLNHRVFLHGFVPEAVLDDTLRQAHLVLNLRHPSMGEASGSQLRIWNAGAPAVVTREGWYASLPENVVYFVDQNEEITQLRALFEKLDAERDAGKKKTGLAGRAYFEANHAPKIYAQEIAIFANEVSLKANQDLALRSRTEQLRALKMHPDMQKRLEVLLAPEKREA